MARLIEIGIFESPLRLDVSGLVGVYLPFWSPLLWPWLRSRKFRFVFLSYLLPQLSKGRCPVMKLRERVFGKVRVHGTQYKGSTIAVV